MAANYAPQVISQVTASVKTMTGVDVRYQGGQWEYSAGSGGTWSAFDNQGQSSLHAQAAQIVAQTVNKSAASQPAQSGVTPTVHSMAQAAIQQNFGKAAALSGTQWIVQNNAGALRSASAPASAAFQAIYDDIATQQQQQQQAAANAAAHQQQAQIMAQRATAVNAGGATPWNPYVSALRQQHQQDATAQAEEDRQSRMRAAASKVWGRAKTVGAEVIVGAYASANFASHAAGSLIDGANSVLQNAFEAGASIAGSIVAGVLAPFGKSGAAIGSVFKVGFSGLGNVASAGLGAAGSVVKGVAGIAGGALSLAGGAVGGLVGGGIGLATAGISAVAGVGAIGGSFIANAALTGVQIGTAIVAGIMHAIAGLASMIDDVMQSAGKVIGEVGKVISTAITAAIDIVQDVTKAALDQSKAILDLSQKTGLSLAQASRAVTAGMAFGIGAGDIHPQNPILGRIQSAIYGGTGDGSLEDISAFRSWRQRMQSGGPVGYLMAGALTPTDKEPYVAAANLPDNLFNRQMDRARGLEMDPSQIERVGQDFKGLTDSVSMFVTTIKTTFLDALLPALTDGLDAAIDYWTKNKEQIINTIFDIGHFLYADLPVMVIKGLQFLNDGAMAMVSQLTYGMKVVAYNMEAMSKMFDDFSKGNPTFLDSISTILKGLDYLDAGFNGFMKVLSFIGYTIVDVVAVVINSITMSLNNLVNAPQAILKFFGLGAVTQYLPKAKIPMIPLLDMYDINVWNDGTDMAGSFENWRNSTGPMNAAKSLHKGANSLDNSADKFKDWSQGQHDALGGLLNRASAAVADNGLKYDDERSKANAERTANATERTAAAAEKQAGMTEKQAWMLMDMFSRVISRAAAYQAEDAYLNLGRVG